jgi:type IV fimbrial biogenesis protein FimT
MVTTSLAGDQSLSGVRYLPMRASGRKYPQRGFTLIELMVGVVLVAILLSTGVPMFRDFILDQRLRATSADINIALMTARSEAVKRNRRVALTPDADGWDAGWTINELDSALAIVEPALLKHVQSADVVITVSDDVRFSPSGRAELPTGVDAIEIEIDSGADATNSVRWACMELRRAGSVDYCRMRCPLPDPLPDPCPA